MAQTYKYGTFDRDDMVGVPESIMRGMAELLSAETPFLTAHSPNLDNLPRPCNDTTHKFHEKQWRPMRTTLTSNITSTATTVVLVNQAAKPGEIIAIPKTGESILLGATSDYLTFTGCTRSVGSVAGTAGVAGDAVLVMGKPWEIGSAAGTPDMVVQPNPVTNYTQIFKRNVGVSGTAAVLDEYHRGRSRYDENVEQQMLNLKHEVENSLLFGVARAAVADTTAGKMEGVFERTYGTGTTDLSGVTPTRDHIRTELRAVKDYGGGSLRKMMFVSDYVKGVIDDWQLPSIRHEAGSPMAKRFGANVQEVELGGEVVPVIPMTKLKTDLIITVPEFVRVGPLRGPGGSREFTHEYLGKDGDRKKGEIVGELTSQVMAPQAIRWLYNVQAS